MEVFARHEPVRLRRLAGAAALLLLTVGCMMGGSTQVHWDLRHSHTKNDVGWTDSLSAHEVANVDLTVQLPGGRTFNGQRVTARMASSDDQVQVLSIYHQPATLDDAYQQARRLAHDWQLKTSTLDSWYQEVQAARKQGHHDRDARFPVSLSGPTLAPGGPTPYARIDYSFDEQRPGLLDFELQWV